MRYQRGLVNYDTCSVAELQGFCSQRGIMSKPEARRLFKSQLVEKLDDADNGETFDKFLDLPAELRQHVYELYFGTLAEQHGDRPAPYPVPITEACSLVRHESIPVYYSTCTFELSIPSDGLPQSSSKHKMRDHMLRFVILGPTRQLAMLKNIFLIGEMQQHIRFDYDRYKNSYNGDFLPYLHCRVDLGTDYKPGTVIFDRNTHTTEHEEDESQRRLSLLRDLLGGIDRRVGGKKLLRSDIRDIAHVFRTPLEPPSKAWVIKEDLYDESESDADDDEDEDGDSSGMESEQDEESDVSGEDEESDESEEGNESGIFVEG